MSGSHFSKVFILCFFSVFWLTQISGASYEKDPIKETQSNVVPVTQELLTREGEPGPASPSFKMLDTSGFLVKKQYVEADTHLAGQVDEESASDEWDDWFSWEEESESSPSTEPVDKE